jgi:hypothetical protein
MPGSAVPSTAPPSVRATTSTATAVLVVATVREKVLAALCTLASRLRSSAA